MSVVVQSIPFAQKYMPVSSAGSSSTLVLPLASLAAASRKSFHVRRSRLITVVS